LIYGLQPLVDDLTTLQYRTKGGQKAPCIIRTRGHRLEGIWHTGSPMGMMLHSLRGMYVLTPRNMTQAAGFYNMLMKSDEPAIVVECLNGYRLKENMPENLNEFSLALGKIEILEEGTDITMISYGSTLRVCQEAIEFLKEHNISVELVDVQSLIPFDISHDCMKSLKKTNRLVIVDEDVEGGASSYILQKVLEEQNGYQYLDCKPLTITAKDHRSAYGSDGDYFSKPNSEEIFNKVYQLMHEAEPGYYPSI
jgi:pyruvate/2-oxoglutarate/acetoin dehydrogenase E1 component